MVARLKQSTRFIASGTAPGHRPLLRLPIRWTGDHWSFHPSKTSVSQFQHPEVLRLFGKKERE